MANLEALKEKARKAREAREELLKNEKTANDAIESKTEETLEEENSADNAKPESNVESTMKFMGSLFSGFGSKYLDKAKKMFDSKSDDESDFESDNGFSSNDENPYSGQSSDIETFDINSDI